MTVKPVKPIFLYRRKGHTDWATCDFQRYAELSDHSLFETRLACDMDERDAIQSLNAELLDALEAIQKSAPSSCCADFHHAHSDRHGPDESCPALDRWESACLAARAAIAKARSAS